MIKNKMAETYIHYGHNTFDLSLFAEPKNRPYFCKPIGGLWASPVNAKRGWREWNNDSGFRDCEEENSFQFQLTEQARVYHIYCKEDVEKLPLQSSDIMFGEFYIDFEQISKLYDAIEYHLSEEKPHENYDDGLYFVLYGWDCDSILVLNKNVIVPTEKAGD